MERRPSRQGYLFEAPPPAAPEQETLMADHDRIQGAAKQVGGKIKEAAGKITGDEKLKAEGRADQAAGKVQNAVGGIKDALRGKD